ncbi:hypothetical protein [Photobacterium leiognathi]|uniref:hypothetical protein n=1 Tax=Photobacterium leiognathi TaxID=553611 RepID=UPI0029811F61|nr:hypothetical protein [Photobacterium leiognathi]
MKNCLINFCFNHKVPTNLKLFVNQVIYWAFAVIFADFFVYYYKQGTIDENTIVPSTLSCIADHMFNTNKIYFYLTIIILCMIMYFLSRKYKIESGKAAILKSAGIIFNKLLSFISLMMGLAIFLRISSYNVDFIENIDAIELILLALFLTHFVVLTIHLEHKK